MSVSGISDLFSFSFPVKMQNWMRFIKVTIKLCPHPAPPLVPSSHLYILRKYVREIASPKGILGLNGEVDYFSNFFCVKHIQFCINFAFWPEMRKWIQVWYIRHAHWLYSFNHFPISVVSSFWCKKYFPKRKVTKFNSHHFEHDTTV